MEYDIYEKKVLLSYLNANYHLFYKGQVRATHTSENSYSHICIANLANDFLPDPYSPRSNA